MRPCSRMKNLCYAWSARCCRRSVRIGKPERSISTWGLNNDCQQFTERKLLYPKKGRSMAPAFDNDLCLVRLTNIYAVIPSSIRKDSWIYNLTTSTTFPCIKGTDKVVVLFRIHPTFTFWTLHLCTSMASEFGYQPILVLIPPS